MTVRQRRLESDHARVTALARDSGGTVIVESTRGAPPVEYRLTLVCRGLERLEGGRAYARARHTVLICLPDGYPSPSAPPQVRFVTPVFNPHVYSNNVVCLGGWLVNEHLDQLVLRLGALIQYDPQALNLGSAANSVAAQWAHRHTASLPLGRETFKAAAREREEVTWRNL
jgi:ubiquitin-protein ligase